MARAAKDADAVPSQTQDAQFLADAFGIVPRRAAELVARKDVDPETLRQRLEAEKTDALAGAPAAQEPRRDFVEDTDETALKPVLHGRNNRTGAG